MVPDKYDKAIAYLTRYPRQIVRALGNPYTHKAGCLFALCCKSRFDTVPGDRTMYGCLTQVRSGGTFISQVLILEIKSDTRIPSDYTKIKVSDLETFAEWQRVLDKELNRA